MVSSFLSVPAAIGLFGAFYYFSRICTMENTPTSKLRCAAQGYVELSGHGKMMDGPPIIAPLTGKHCTCFSYQVEEHRYAGKNSRWVTIDEGVSDSLFLIIDKTGQCIIDPEGASVTAVESDTWYGHSRRPGSDPQVSGGFLNFRSVKYRYND